MVIATVLTDAGLVQRQGLHALPLRLIPLWLAGRADLEQFAATTPSVELVDVLVMLLGLPPEQALLGNSERAGQSQAVSSGAVTDEPLSPFGTLSRVSCISTIIRTAAPRSAEETRALIQPDQSSGPTASSFHAMT